MTTNPPTAARDRLFALIASIPGSGAVDWCGEARTLLDEIAAPSVSPPPATDRATLRDRIAEALYAHSHPGWATHYTDLDRDERETYLARASAVLAVLPQPADRAAVLREAADELDAHASLLADVSDDPAAFVAKARARAATEWRVAVALLRRMADEAQQQRDTDTPREWCKCPSCWGWFVEEHPGEDLDELGRDLGWWSGLPEHRDAPAGVADENPAEMRCTCADAGDCFVPAGHYADCPQADAPAVVAQPGKET